MLHDITTAQELLQVAKSEPHILTSGDKPDPDWLAFRLGLPVWIVRRVVDVCPDARSAELVRESGIANLERWLEPEPALESWGLGNIRFIVVLGASGSGKDALAGALVRRSVEPIRLLKFKHVYTTYLAQAYGFNHRWLDGPEGKACLVPDTQQTWAHQLLEAYEFHKANNPTLTAHAMANRLWYDRFDLHTCVFTDCRPMPEATMLVKMANILGANIHVVHLEGRGSVLSADTSLEQASAYFQQKGADSYRRINNSPKAQLDLNKLAAELLAQPPRTR